MLAVPAIPLDPGKSMTQYAHRIWGQEEGLFQPTIYSILQTRDGFLWLGTQDSLIRFDGVHFREFAEGASILHGSLIRAMAEDKQGNLWVGSLGSGLVRITPGGRVEQYSIKNGLPSDTVFGLTTDPDGSVWASTNEGLAQISSGHVRVFTGADGLPSKRIRTTCRASDGTRWVADLDSGLARWDGSSAASEMLKGRNVTALVCAADDSVWAGTPEGLIHVSGSRVVTYTKASGLPDDEVSALAEGPNGTLWIGTKDGVSRLSERNISVYRTRDGLSHSEVLALCTDREGTLWAGTKNGLDQFTDGKVTPYTVNEGLSSNDVGPVLEDNSGYLWVGTSGRGLNSFDGQVFRTVTTRDGLDSDIILSLALDPSGDLWVGTGLGLNRIHGHRVIASFTEADGLRGHQVRSLFVDAHGTLWIGTESALQRFENGRFVAAQTPGSPKRSGVIALNGGRTTPLFASFETPGLLVLRDGQLSPYPLETTHAVDCFFIDRLNRTIWMGTLGSGLLRWKEGHISRVYVKDGLYDNRIYSILQDAKSNLWLASSKGIFRLSLQELNDFSDGRRKTVTSLPFTTGQLRFECRPGVQPAACRTKDGRLWFATTSGLVVLDPNHLGANEIAPPVAVTAMLINGKRFSPHGEPHLKPSDPNNIEIRYAGLSFISPEKVGFRYRLAGYDRAWTDAGARREAFYTNLPPGYFEFQVEAENADGIWSAQPAVLKFVVEPKLYQRRWFFPFLVLALGLTVATWYRFRIRRLRSRFALVLAERNRIARELHDTLLQGLSGITMQMQAVWAKLPYSPEKRALGEIISDAGRCSTEARRSLWGLRTNSSRAAQFSEKLIELARQTARDKGLALSFKVEPVALADHPDAEYQLIRIAGEALSNTVKHACATQVSVSLQASNGVVSLGVQDNGIGFSPSMQQPAGHYGLQGMRERATEIGAELSIVSSPGHGTAVLVAVPLSTNVPNVESNHEVAGAHQLH